MPKESGSLPCGFMLVLLVLLATLGTACQAQEPTSRPTSVPTLPPTAPATSKPTSTATSVPTVASTATATTTPTSRPAETPPASPTPIPSASGPTLPPPSEDREALAFALEQDGQWDIYTSEPDGSNLFQVTDTPEREVRPQWSPDGKQIAFAHYWSGEYRSETGLFLINHDGTDTKQIVDRLALTWSWSPDSGRLAYTALDSHDRYCDEVRPRSWSLHILDVATGRDLAVAPGANFSVWSPNGEGVFYAIWNSETQRGIVEFLSITGEVQQTDVNVLPLASSAISGQVIWGGTGQRLISILAEEGVGQRWVWASDAQGSDPRKIAELNPEDWDFPRDEDGPYLVLFDIWASDELMTLCGAYLWYQRTISQDGNKFAFVSVRAGEDDSGERLHLTIIDSLAGEPSVTSLSFRSLIDDWDGFEDRVYSHLEDRLVDLNRSWDSSRLFYSVADPVGCCRLPSNWRFF